MTNPIVAALAVLASAFAIASSETSAPHLEARHRRFAPGCASVTHADSALILDWFQRIVTDPSPAARNRASLPEINADSVRYGGTGAQCDSVAARYRAFHAGTADSVPILPIMLIRIGATRWVGDPRVSRDSAGRSREWIILDSSFAIVKMWRTTGW